ncbi:G-type lectin S-receptor-like serine/threonine-protein kinase RLK1 [Morus notabilis]|uniref:Receptor-like serine/threonine-protein kinase n=1 Tax=Morus notabilis TaxID=981085 RepID=W9SA90_9ROSA|nr:G-type lectin S-receptor-like serine/threonine-protein kinase RLK1 [Morus notabilis]
MAFFLKLLFTIAFVLIKINTSEAQEIRQDQSNVSLGSSLTPDKNLSWLSNSGLYAFGFYKQGNGYSVGIFLAGIAQKTVVWTADRDSAPVTSNATLLFTSEGRLVLRPTQGKDYYDIADSSLPPASSASMLDSGNFVLYNSDGGIIWQSFEHPTDTLLPTQHLAAGNELVSSVSDSDHSSGIFRLKMQKDGNLCQYPVGTPDEAPHSYFTSWTDGKGKNVSLVFDSNGYLYLMNTSNGLNMKNISDTSTYEGYYTRNKTSLIFLMRIDSDGIFRVYSHGNSSDDHDESTGSWSVEWSSSKNKCDPKGVCGLNGFCVSNGDQEQLPITCRCLPGFDFVNKTDKSSGCKRNISIADICGNERMNFTFTMEELPNTGWYDNTYSDLSLQQKEACTQDCLSDCNCEAAFYKDGKCRKQKLPLRYGVGLQSDSNIALVKVYTPKSTIDQEPALPKETDERSVFRRNFLIIGVVLVVFGFMMMVISIVLFRKSKVWTYRKMDFYKEAELGDEVALRPYTYEELEKMTEGFKEEIGRGSFGTVYKGRILYSGKVVAVKRLGRLLPEQGDREFQNEMKAIGRIHHRNLVRLLGFCREGPNRLLVYEYMANGSLADMLFTPGKHGVIRWDERVKISCEIARGIVYLHEECETQMIHCDIKPQNILMDEKICAKISDFGLAKLLRPDQTQTFTGIRGTRGYVAPEWHKKFPVTVKADVYSFGIVLLEIICRRRNVAMDVPEEEAILEEWARYCFENGELRKLVVDDENVDESQLERMVKVALWCLEEEPSLRPSMKNVLLMLEGILDVSSPLSPNSFT